MAQKLIIWIMLKKNRLNRWEPFEIEGIEATFIFSDKWLYEIDDSGRLFRSSLSFNLMLKGVIKK